MGTTYLGVVSGTRSKTGPSGFVMTHFNLRTDQGETHHIIAMREGSRKCRGVEVVRDGIRAQVTGEWAPQKGNQTRNFFAKTLALVRAPAATAEPLKSDTPAAPAEDLWWDWEQISAAS